MLIQVNRNLRKDSGKVLMVSGDYHNIINKKCFNLVGIKSKKIKKKIGFRLLSVWFDVT